MTRPGVRGVAGARDMEYSLHSKTDVVHGEAPPAAHAPSKRAMAEHHAMRRGAAPQAPPADDLDHPYRYAHPDDPEREVASTVALPALLRLGWEQLSGPGS